MLTGQNKHVSIIMDANMLTYYNNITYAGIFEILDSDQRLNFV